MTCRAELHTGNISIVEIPVYETELAFGLQTQGINMTHLREISAQVTVQKSLCTGNYAKISLGSLALIPCV